LIGESGTAELRPDAQHGYGREDGGAQPRESASFLSTHLLRELLAADARGEAAGDPLAERAEALLAVILAGLELAEGAIVQADAAGTAGLCLASRGVPDHARELLEARQPRLESMGGSLLQRALGERRVLLLDRGTRDPLMPALRDGNPDIECAVVVPLVDHSVAVGVLLLAARGRRLSPTFVRSLAVAFRLLGLLLAPGRGRSAAATLPDEPQAAPGDGERLLFEIEELAARLAEARETARQMEERASASDAALRAESESARARVAELEAQLAGTDPARARELELETLCAEQGRTIDQHERRVADLEGEIATLMDRIAHLSDDGRPPGNGATTWNEPALDEPEAEVVFTDEHDEPATTIELVEDGDEQLGDIAAAAVAALGEDFGGDASGDVVGETTIEVEAGDDALAASYDATGDGEVAEDGAAEEGVDEGAELVAGDAVDEADDEAGGEAVVLADAPPPPEPATASSPTPSVLLADTREAARARARAAADEIGAGFWDGAGVLPPVAGSVLAVNLLDDALVRLVERDDEVWSASRWIVYGADGETGLGFDLGSCALIRRPIEPRRALGLLRAMASAKLNGILLVSAQLREVAGLRQALQEVDVASSVACDTRQALDLLEIIRRPDAIVIDLALAQGQALALAAQLRRQPETSSLPLLLLLPAVVEPSRLVAEADKAQLLGPFVDEDVHRLVRATLAGRH